MNRLILIGNGFDLAHGLKTDYNSFILWYLKDCFEKALKRNEYHDELLDIRTRFSLQGLPSHLQTVSAFINFFYKSGLGDLQGEKFKIKEYTQEFMNPFFVKFKPQLGQTLLEKCNYQSWVDIENDFYYLLKQCFFNNAQPKQDEIKKLNNSLKFIIERLELYLLTLKHEKVNPEYSKILSSEINVNDIIFSQQDLYNGKMYSNQAPNETLVLNFNYTTTIEKYLKPNDMLPLISNSIEVNYIHGRVDDENNPLIFGFGDELDENYKKMEDSKTNEFFEYIKSFWYFKTSNYHSLIRFIESEPYQIYILGHSCGLSDRTLLNMLFEHTNCKSIKIYYYENDEKTNNYTTLTQEISRHFKDKVAMRRKIVPRNLSEIMPQVE